MSKVLIVDESISTALTTKWQLERQGATATATLSLPAALEALRRVTQEFEVAIVAGDLNLTRYSEAVTALQSANPKLKVLCMGECADSGLDTVVSKPIGETEAQRLVAEYELKCRAPKDQRVIPYRRELLCGKKILLVDRDRIFGNFVPMLFETEYLLCTVLDSVEEAFSLIKSQNFDCVVIMCDDETSDLLKWMRADNLATPAVGLCVDPNFADNGPMFADIGMAYMAHFPLQAVDALEAVWKAVLPTFEGHAEDLETIVSNPVMDVDGQLRNFDSDWEFVMELLEMFLAEGTEKMNIMMSAAYEWKCAALKSSSHSMKGCSHSSGLFSLGTLCSAVDLLAKSLKESDFGFHVALQQQLAQFICTMAMQEYIRIIVFQQKISSLKSVKIASGLELSDGSYSALIKTVVDSLEKIWPFVEAEDNERLVETIITNDHLEVVSPSLFDAALDCKADDFDEEAISALESACMGLLDDVSVLVGSRNLPHCCARIFQR